MFIDDAASLDLTGLVPDTQTHPETRLERRNARIYLTGLGCSLIGNSALSLVTGIWVKSLTGSSSQAALVSVCIYLPSLLGPVGGLLADRVRQRTLLIGLDVASAGIVLTLLLVRSREQVWLIYAVVLWYGTSLTLSGPAESALFTRMSSPAARARVNGRSVALQEIGRLVSPLAGAGLFAASGGGVVAGVDAATFLVGATATTLVRVHDAPEPAAHSRWRSTVTAGLHQLWSIHELQTITLLAVVPMFLSGVLVAAQYSLVSALHRPPSFLGVLSACLGAGSIAASLGAGRMIAHIGERNLAALAVLNFVLGSALRATGMLAPALIGSLVLGAALPWSLIALITAGQRLTPLPMQGQISAAITLVMFAPQPLSLGLGAVLINPIGFRLLYAAVAALLLVATLPLLRRHTPTERPTSGR